MLFPLALVLVHIPAMPLLNNSKGIFIIRGYLYNNIQLRVSLQCSTLFPLDLKSESEGEGLWGSSKLESCMTE